jgi:hypothetical protein
MNLRNPHGAGASVDPTTPRLERTPPDEQPYPPTALADPIAAGRDRKGRVTTREAASALAKLPRRHDVLPEAIACHPDFERHYRRRLDWRKRRGAELDTYTSARGGNTRNACPRRWRAPVRQSAHARVKRGVLALSRSHRPKGRP